MLIIIISWVETINSNNKYSNNRKQYNRKNQYKINLNSSNKLLKDNENKY